MVSGVNLFKGYDMEITGVLESSKRVWLKVAEIRTQSKTAGNFDPKLKKDVEKYFQHFVRVEVMLHKVENGLACCFFNVGPQMETLNVPVTFIEEMRPVIPKTTTRNAVAYLGGQEVHA